VRCLGLARFGLLLLLLVARPVQAGLAPTGEPFVLTHLEGRHGSPLLAARPDGTYLMAWNAVLPSGPALYGGFFGPSGAPLAPSFEIQAGAIASPALSMLPDGGFAIVWEQAGAIFGGVFDRDGHVRFPRFEVAAADDPKTPFVNPSIAVGADGGLVVLWQRNLHPLYVGDADVLGRWLEPDGTPKTPPLRIPYGYSNGWDWSTNPRVAVLPNGRFLAVWTNHQPGLIGTNVVFQGRVFDSEGVAVLDYWIDLGGGLASRLFPLHSEQGFIITQDPKTPNEWFSFQRINAEGRPVGPDVSPHFPRVPEHGTHHGIAIDPAGRLLLIGTAHDRQVYSQLFDGASLQTLNTPSVLPTRRPGTSQPTVASARPGQFLTVWEDAASGHILGEVLALGCETGQGICLNQSRFRVEVSWRDHQGNTGAGHSVPLTDDTASFWFFTPSNVELLVKVLDGRPVNGKFWVFYGSLSDVEYEIRVEDTLTGDLRTYKNPAGTLASRADVLAFPPSAGARETVTAALEEIPVVGRSTVEPLSPPIACHSSETALCLQPLYQVTVELVDPLTGADRQARAVPFSQESGAFWFFDEKNLELFVKVLDGTEINGRAWVFHGALTDVEYTITVRDLMGAEWTYHNPRGRMHSGADTSALPPPLSY
jgi:hypothetical protein